MPAPESASGATTLHNTIEQLIADTVKQSQLAHDAEKTRLTGAMAAALTEIETSQRSLNRAVETLRAALADNADAIEPQNAEPASAEATPVAPETPVVEPSAVDIESEPGPKPTPTSERGTHELDIIAHNASITDATGLQAWFRGRDEVTLAQTREFVGGELRLHLMLGSGLPMDEFTSWLKDHGGSVVTNTASVIEIRFSV